MKKIIKTILAATLFSLAFNGFADDTDVVFRGGVFGQGNAIINGHSNDAAADLGGGISLESKPSTLQIQFMWAAV